MDTRIALIAVLLTNCTVKGQGQLCSESLIQSLPDDHVTASSSLSDATVLTEPPQGRLGTTERTLNNGSTLIGAWSPTTDNKGEYIQAIFDEMTMINAIQTQGRNLGSDHVTLYKVAYTEDGNTWHTLNNDIGVEQIFMGNIDGDTVQDSPLVCPMFARGIRIVPLEWDKHIALRFDISGCYIDNSIVVTTASSATTSILTTIVSTPSILTTIVSTPSILTTIATTNATPPASFLPGILTPFGLTRPTTGTTLVTTPTRPLTTTNRGTTVNLLTLIHWFMTHINNHTGPTTPIVTTTPTVLTTPTIKRTTPTTAKTTPTTSKTTPTTPVTTPTTTAYNFLPGILHPFGTTKTMQPAFQPGSGLVG